MYRGAPGCGTIIALSGEFLTFKNLGMNCESIQKGWYSFSPIASAMLYKINVESQSTFVIKSGLIEKLTNTYYSIRAVMPWNLMENTVCCMYLWF